jgi:hypothetical protein
VRIKADLPVFSLESEPGGLGNRSRGYECKQALVAEKIPCLSSHTIVSPNDPRGYLLDSHFTDKIDEKLAEALVKLLANPETSDFCKDVHQ